MSAIQPHFGRWVPYIRPSAGRIARDVAERHGMTYEDLVKRPGRRGFYASLVRAQAVRAIRAQYPMMLVARISERFNVSKGWISKISQPAAAAAFDHLPIPHEVLAQFAADNKAAVRDIVGQDRFVSILDLRYRAIRHVHERCPHISTTDLGILFNRDHSTIVYALGLLKGRSPSR